VISFIWASGTPNSSANSFKPDDHILKPELKVTKHISKRIYYKLQNNQACSEIPVHVKHFSKIAFVGFEVFTA
jgi:hypothetical protein